MAALNELFDSFDDALKLNPAERARAIAAHNRLTVILVAAGIAKRTRLQGSFARKTMLPPLKDIDKVIEFVDELRDLLAAADGPEQAMKHVQAALGPHYPDAEFEIKKHALCIRLPGDGFDFDAVLAFNAEDGTGWIVIADTEDHDWEPSNTYVLIDVIAERNQACDGRFVRQVRMLKQAVRNAGLADVLPGLHVETFAHAAIESSMPHADAVTAALAAAASMLGTPYYEPTGVDRISDRLDPDEVATARASMQQLAARAAEAQRLAAAGEEQAAAAIWWGIFGDLFPAPRATEEAFLSSLHNGSALGASGAVMSSARTPRTRAWRPT